MFYVFHLVFNLLLFTFWFLATPAANPLTASGKGCNAETVNTGIFQENKDMRKWADSGETESGRRRKEEASLFASSAAPWSSCGSPEEGRGPKKRLLREARLPERGSQPPKPSCVTLGRLLSLSVPQLPHLENGRSDSPHLIRFK